MQRRPAIAGRARKNVCGASRPTAAAPAV